MRLLKADPGSTVPVEEASPEKPDKKVTSPVRLRQKPISKRGVDRSSEGATGSVRLDDQTVVSGQGTTRMGVAGSIEHELQLIGLGDEAANENAEANFSFRYEKDENQKMMETFDRKQMWDKESSSSINE